MATLKVPLKSESKDKQQAEGEALSLLHSTMDTDDLINLANLEARNPGLLAEVSNDINNKNWKKLARLPFRKWN